MLKHTGSCLCGAVSFIVDQALPEAEVCHCTFCRKWSGHHLVSVEVDRDALRLSGKDSISWYQSSIKARRGFCRQCGSALFFDPLDKQKHRWIGILMGAFDKPTKTQIGFHIFTDEKGDYYQINDGLPQK